MTTAEQLESEKLPTGHFGFSHVRMDRLGATEYTLVTLCVDKSASISDFRKDIEACVAEVVKACRESPRADNLQLRVVMFGHAFEEFHGFRLLEDCRLDDYKGMLGRLGHATCLFDACQSAVEATNVYAQKLTSQDYSVNGIVVAITDGVNNSSTFGIPHVAAQLQAATKQEFMESLVSILVGVNITDPTAAAQLDEFHREAGFTQFVQLGDASAKTLARLAEFVSQSISSQSQALGSGGPSVPLTF